MLPCGTIHYVDAEVSQSTDAILVVNEGSLVEIDARCKGNELVQLVCIVVMLKLCQSEEHLGSAHGISEVSDFLLSCLCDDLAVDAVKGNMTSSDWSAGLALAGAPLLRFV